MTELFINAEICEDVWLHIDDDELLPEVSFSTSFSRWCADHDALLSHCEKLGVDIGVRLSLDDDPQFLEPSINVFKLVQIRLGSMTDGRIYSVAARLRQTYRYANELRVAGDIPLDQIALMRRCGINAFEFPRTIDPSALQLRFNHYYQSGGGNDPGESVITGKRLTMSTERSIKSPFGEGAANDVGVLRSHSVPRRDLHSESMP